jgi:hypothetical protein
VDFLSNRHSAKSASEKPWRAKEEDTEYQRPKSGVWRKYLKICLTVCRCWNDPDFRERNPES